MSQDNNGWIKCSERLPDPKDMDDGLERKDLVLIFYKEYDRDSHICGNESHVGMGWYVKEYMPLNEYESGYMFYWEHDNIDIGSSIKVSHWQPLPPPPTE